MSCVDDGRHSINYYKYYIDSLNTLAFCEYLFFNLCYVFSSLWRSLYCLKHQQKDTSLIHMHRFHQKDSNFDANHKLLTVILDMKENFLKTDPEQDLPASCWNEKSSCCATRIFLVLLEMQASRSFLLQKCFCMVFHLFAQAKIVLEDNDGCCKCRLTSTRKCFEFFTGTVTWVFIQICQSIQFGLHDTRHSYYLSI